MTESLVGLDGQDGVFTLTLRRPDVLNALSTALCREAVGRSTGSRPIRGRAC